MRNGSFRLNSRTWPVTHSSIKVSSHFTAGLLDFSGLPLDMGSMCAKLPQLVEVIMLVVTPCILSLWLHRRTKDRLNGKSPPKPLFEYPAIEPCVEELSQIKPIPYRPFRWGAYQ